jgi:hypothetical protein
MKTYKLKDAITVLAHGGFIKEPGYYFSTHAPLFDKYGAWIGNVTYNCYFDITETLGYSHNDGLLKSGRYTENAPNDDAWSYSTITGNFDLVSKMKQLAY